MVPFTSVSGSSNQTREKEEVCKSGRTAPYMKATGRATKLAVMVDCCTRMETSTKESGWTTRLMASASITTRMDHSTEASGLTIRKMAVGSSVGLTVATSRATMLKA